MLNLKQFGQSRGCLSFIERRLEDDNYRGEVSSQHNRYTFDEVEIILQSLDSHTDGDLPMLIRTADLSKRPHDLPHEEIYARFCADVSARIHKGSQDAMRKNYFPDFHRAGWIERFDKNGKSISPWKQAAVAAVRLSTAGKKLIMSKSKSEKYFLFSKGIGNLLGNYIDILLNALRDEDRDFRYIDNFEFTLFLSAVDTNTSFNLNIEEAKALIAEWRAIPRIQRAAIVAHLSKALKPTNFAGDKIAKRDWHNWINKTEQIFSLLDQTVYFEQRKEKNSNRLVYMKGRVEGEEGSKRLDRSLTQKFKYFENHGVSKISGFELHHVVALAWAESQQHFKLLDDWRNMVYIDAFSHAKITQNRNQNVIMSYGDDAMELKSYSGDTVMLEYRQNIALDIKLLPQMLEYNTELLHK